MAFKRLTLFLPLLLVGFGAAQSTPQADCPVALGVELPANTACPGPFEVVRFEYDSRQAHPEGLNVSGIDFPVDVWGLGSYPKGFLAGPAPLVLILHGNQGQSCTGVLGECPQHEGFSYLIDHLASQGFIAVSVNANRINTGDFDRVPERGYLLLEHLRRWRQWATRADPMVGDVFVGHVDLNRIGLAGHSRGGEAVIAAYNLNLEEPTPFEIGAVLSLAPTDKRGLSIKDVPYYAIVPACDGDVLDYRGVRFFDRALVLKEDNPTPKQVAYVLGANHNYFNTLWGRNGGGCSGVELLEQTEQQTLTKRLTSAFFRRYLNGETALHDVFTGDRTLPASSPVPIWFSYVDPVRLEVDNFARPEGENRLGGMETTKDFRHAFTCGPSNAQPCSLAFVNESAALALEWRGKASVFKTVIPPAFSDVSAYTHLSFRTTQNPQNAQLDGFDPAGTPLQFEVQLSDRFGHRATVSTEGFGGAPFPIGSTVRDPASGKALRRAVYRTLRIPLAAFEGVDLTQIEQVAFLFSSAKGSLYLGNIQFTR